jgi:hypothetical protein
MKGALPSTLLCSAVLLAITAGVTGCSDPEAEARKMQNLAITAEKEGRGDDARRIYEELVAKYPQTQSAVEANKQLLVATRVNEAVEKIKDAVTKQQIDDLRAALDIVRLEVGRYPSTEEGLNALIAKPAGMKSWNGPYLKDPVKAKRLFNKLTYRLEPGKGPIIEPVGK